MLELETPELKVFPNDEKIKSFAKKKVRREKEMKNLLKKRDATPSTLVDGLYRLLAKEMDHFEEHLLLLKFSKEEYDEAQEHASNVDKRLQNEKTMLDSKRKLQQQIADKRKAIMTVQNKEIDAATKVTEDFREGLQSKLETFQRERMEKIQKAKIQK